MSGAVLQTLVSVGTKQENVGAVKSLNLDIQIPNLNEENIESINVVELNPNGTDGKFIRQAKLPEDNYKYENGILTINKTSQTWLIENQVLKDKNEIKDLVDTGQEEMYYSSPGKEEFLITYILKTKIQEKLNSNIKAKVTTFGKNEFENIATKDFEYDLIETQNTISYKEETDQTEISKGYMYYNYNIKNQNLYDIEYKSKKILNISCKNLVDEIYIEDLSNQYIDNNENEFELKDIYYKQISVSKENFDTILGDTGQIEIQRSDGSLVASLKGDSDEENGYYLYKFDSNESNIILKISKPITEGNLILEITKAQTNSEYSKDEYKEFEYIVSKSHVRTNFGNEEEQLQEIETKLHLKETVLQPSVELSLNKVPAFAQSLARTTIKLNNDSVDSEIYGEAKFNIEFPKYINEVSIDNYNIVYGEGLEIDNVNVTKNDLGNSVVVVTTKGLQERPSSGTYTDGTNIILNLKLSSENNLNNLNTDLKFTFENHVPEIITESGEMPVDEIIQGSIRTIDQESTDSLEENKLKGTVWIDENLNGIKDEEENKNTQTNIFLVDTSNGSIVENTKSDSEGNYEFENVDEGKYVVLFEYDSDNYKLSNYQSSLDEPENNSDVISAKVEYNGNQIDGAVTEVITVEKAKTINANMGLIQTDNFDLELTNRISRIVIKNKSGEKEIVYNNVNLAKAELPEKLIDSSTIDIEYLIEVKNIGEVDGYAKEIVDYIPKGLTFDKDKNPNWYYRNGDLVTRTLSTKKIAKGEKEQVKLILTLEMTDGNTRLVNNTAEIAEDYNELGLEDINSKPLNKVDSENDYDSADLIISVKTGGKFIYTSVLLTTIMLGGIIVFILISKLRIKERKEGGV